MNRFLKVFAGSSIAASFFFVSLFGQDISAVTKDDWEEINFEFDSAKLVDGFPSLLRIAEFLKANPAFKVKIDGHTDVLGTSPYNEDLGNRRASAVRDFLLKYGATASQLQVVSQGERAPKAPGQKPYYSRTDEARWMNRRVVLTVLDAQGRAIGVGGAADAIRAMNQSGAGGMKDCCNEVLKRLDQLDEILRRVKELQDQNAGLKRDVDELKAQNKSIQDKLAALGSGTGAAAGPGAGAGTAAGAGGQQTAGGPGGAGAGTAGAGAGAGADKNAVIGAGPGGPTGHSGSKFVDKFSLLGVNLGADSNGKTTFTGKGRFFAPMGDNFAFQAQGEYLYFNTQREGQLDFGLVHRINRVQAGLFAAFKHVNLRGLDGGTLGQASLSADYLFGRGKIGVFGTKGFMDESVVGRSRVVLSNGALAANLFREQYLRIVDQAGVSGVMGLVRDIYAEGNVGYLKAYGSGDRMGGTLRFVFPISEKVAFTAEGGVNETFLGRNGSTGRAVFGVQWGNLLRPREFVASGRPVPVDVPRIRYELLSRTVREGAIQPPVADAGPDQTGVNAGPIRLDGSGSYDPNGEKLTYQWIQETGPSVSLTAATSAITNFTAAAGQVYGFRLTVRNESGLTASARVRVTTRSEDRVQILFFIANPTQVRQGATSELSWKVLNAEEVTISGIGPVAAEGRAPVTVNDNITYRLTAKNRISEENATAAITVIRLDTRVVSCFASPATITSGQSSTLSWVTENADSVVIEPGVGSVAVTGSVSVTPTSTTTYRILASGAGGQTSSCTTTVTVNEGALPRIVRFSADPISIVRGSNSTLTWSTEGAETVSITTLGSVDRNGTREVSPQQTTTYVLTATNAAGSSTASATITVTDPPQTAGPRITSFTADPAVSPTPGARVLLTCLAENATNIDIQPNNGVNTVAQTLVYPRVDTTYTCTATGANGAKDTKTLTVRVTQPPDPPKPDPNVPVIVIAGGNDIETLYRQLTLDASATTSPTGDTPLSFRWSSPNTQAAIQTPNSPITIVQLNQLIGDFFFDLEVTDAKGRKALQRVVVRLVKRPVI